MYATFARPSHVMHAGMLLSSESVLFVGGKPAKMVSMRSAWSYILSGREPWSNFQALVALSSAWFTAVNLSRKPTSHGPCKNVNTSHH